MKGWLRVWTVAAKGPALPTDIPFSFEMTRGIDKTKQLALFLGLLVLGLGRTAGPVAGHERGLIPLPGGSSTVAAANLPVIVRYQNGRVVRVGADDAHGRLPPLRERLPSASPPSDSFFQEELHLGKSAGLRFSARPPINPFGVGFATATPEEGTAHVAREGRKVNLALSLAGSWIFLYDPDATNAASRRLTGSALRGEPPEIHGRVLAFIAQGPVPPQADRLVRDIDVRLAPYRPQAGRANATLPVGASAGQQPQGKAAKEARTAAARPARAKQQPPKDAAAKKGAAEGTQARIRPATTQRRRYPPRHRHPQRRHAAVRVQAWRRPKHHDLDCRAPDDEDDLPRAPDD